LMSIQRAEELKREWTDRHVRIRRGVPELQRFDGLVGQVRTVNMNCRLLIEFDTPADISWYDIDPQFVTLVESVQAPPSSDESVDTTKRSPHTADTASVTDAAQADVSGAKAAPTTPTGAATGLSPLDQIRRQAATTGSPPESGRQQDAAADSVTPQPAAGVEKPTAVSPLDQIRQQAAGKATKKSTGNSQIQSTVQPEVVPSSTPADKALAASAPVTSNDVREPSAAEPPLGAAAAPSAATSVSSNPFDQIRAQAAAGSDSFAVGERSGTPTIFDQIRAQAAEGQLDSV
jgi:hypothetical protein